MANLLPLNTSYKSTSTTKLKIPVPKVPEISATELKTPAKQSSSILPKLQTQMSNIGITYNPENLGITPTTINPEAVELGQPLISAPGVVSVASVPTGYTFSEKTGENIPYTPPETARFANLSKYIGGGVLAKDVADKNKTYLSYRADTPQQKAIMRGGLLGSLTEIDHIVPEWLGGTDTPENKQILSWEDHAKKTAVGEVALQLYNSKKISKNEALAISLNWQDKDVEGIKVVDAQGNYKPLDRNDALTIYQKWQEPKKLTFSDYWAAAKTASSDNEKLNYVLEAAKGVVEGLSFGLIKMGQTDFSQSGGGDKASLARFGGSVLGFGASYALTKGALAGTIGAAAKIAGPSKAAITAAEAAGQTVKAGKLATTLTKAESLFRPQVAKYDTFWKLAKDGKLQLAAKRSAAAVLKAATGDVITNNIIGQLTEFGMPTEERNRLSRVFYDTANGLMMGVTPPGMKGTASVAISTSILSRMEGASVEDSLRNGVVFGALHGASSLRGGGRAMEANIKKQAVDSVIRQRETYLSRVGEKAYTTEQLQAMKPADRYERLKYESSIIDDQLAKMYSSGEPLVGTGLTGTSKSTNETSEAYLAKWHNEEMGKKIAGESFLLGNVEYKTVPMWQKQAEMDWAGFNSKYNTPSVPLRISEHIPQEMARYVEHNTDQFGIGERKSPLLTPEQNSFLEKKLSSIEDPGMKIQITGQAVDGSPQSSEINLAMREAIEQSRKSGKPVRVFAVDTPELAYIQTKRTDYTDPYPTKNISVVAEINGDLKVLGHVPTAERIGKVSFADPENPVIISSRANSQNEKIISSGFKDQDAFLNPDHNKDTLHDYMDNNQVKVMELEVVQSGIGNKSEEPYFILKTSPEKIQEAIIRNFDLPQEKRYITTENIIKAMDLSKRRPGEATAETLSASKKVITSPVEEIKNIPVIEVPGTGVLPAEVTMKTTVDITRSRARVTDFLDEVKAAIETGDAKMVKATVDNWVGKNVITIKDAKAMIADKNELSLADILPVDANTTSILEAGNNTSNLNQKGMDLVGDFKLLTSNDPEFIKVIGEAKNRSFINNNPIDIAKPLPSSTNPTTKEVAVSRRTNVSPENRHPELASKVAVANKKAAVVPKKAKEAKLPIPATKASPVAAEMAKTTTKKEAAPPDFLNPEVGKQVKTNKVGTQPSAEAVAELDFKKPSVNLSKNKFYVSPEEATVVVKEGKNPSLPAADPENQISVASKAPKRKLGSYENVDSILDIPSEDLIAPTKWNSTTSGVLSKPYNALTLKQQELLKAGDYKTANAIQVEKGNMSPDKFEYRAKEEFAKAKGDPQKAFSSFVDSINNYFEKRTGSKIVTNYEDLQDLKHNFHRWVEAMPTKTFVFKDGKISLEAGEKNVASRADDRITVYKKDNKLPKDSMEVVTFNKNKSKFSSGTSNPDKAIALRDSLAKDGYVLFATKSNDVGSLMAVKFEPELAKKYDANPEKYKFKTDEAFTGTPKEIEHEKFYRVFLTDVLGIPNTLTADGIAKRWNLIFNREVKDKSPIRNITKIVLPTEKLGDLGVIDEKILSSKDESVLKGIREKSQFDGKRYISQEYAKSMADNNGFSKDKKHFKTTTYHVFEEGGKKTAYIDKGDTAVLTPTLEKYFSDRYGVDFTKLRKQYGVDFEITFDDNIKIGKGIGDKVSTSLGEGRILSVPSDSVSIKFLGEPGESSRFSLSNTAKFGAEDGINDVISTLYSPNAKKFTQLVNEISENKESIDSIFKKYKKDFGLDTENWFGVKSEIAKLGAGKKYLKHEIEDTLIKSFQNKAMDLSSNTKTAHMYASPDLGYEVNGKREFLKPGEVMISADKAKSLNVKEGDNVLAWRNPVSRKTALYKAKVKIGENYGVDYLGNDHTIASHHDISVRMEGDYDGDTINFMKIGGKDGVPKKMVDVIEQKRSKEGDVALPALTPFDKKPLNLKNTLDIISNQLAGSEGIGMTASSARVMNLMKDNKWKMIVHPADSDGKRLYEVYLGDEKINRGFTKTPGSHDGTLDITMNWDPDHEYMYTRVLQEAVDSIKSKDLQTRGFDKEYLPSHSVEVKGEDARKVFKADAEVSKLDDKELSKIISNEMFKYQDIFQISDPNNTRPAASVMDLVSKIKTFNSRIEKAVKGGGKVSPIQEVSRLYEDINYDNFKNETVEKIGGAEVKIQDAEKNRLWLEAAKKQKEVLSEAMKDNIKSPAVQSFIDEAKKTKSEYNRFDRSLTPQQRATKKLETRSKLVEYYNANKNKYTQADKDAIVYWLTTDPAANIKESYNVKTPDGQIRHEHVWLYDEILPESPVVAKQFFNFFEGRE